MFSKFEWEYLINLTVNIMSSKSYEETCETVISGLDTLFYFSRVTFIKLYTSNNNLLCKHYLAFKRSGPNFVYADTNTLTKTIVFSNYWSLIARSKGSSVVFMSDIWKNHTEYNEYFYKILQPDNLKYGLTVVIEKDKLPVMLIGFQREEKWGDYTQKDYDILSELIVVLKEKFHEYEDNISRLPANTNTTYNFLKNYDITKKEFEIIELISNELGTDDICKELFISHSTFNKHISNIYKKTGVKNRVELLNLYKYELGKNE